jgi:hypothetical protein
MTCCLAAVLFTEDIAYSSDYELPTGSKLLCSSSPSVITQLPKSYHNKAPTVKIWSDSGSESPDPPAGVRSRFYQPPSHGRTLDFGRSLQSRPSPLWLDLISDSGGRVSVSLGASLSGIDGAVQILRPKSL